MQLPFGATVPPVAVIDVSPGLGLNVAATPVPVQVEVAFGVSATLMMACPPDRGKLSVMLKFGIETVGFGLVTVKVSFVGAPPNIIVYLYRMFC